MRVKSRRDDDGGLISRLSLVPEQPTSGVRAGDERPARISTSSPNGLVEHPLTDNEVKSIWYREGGDGRGKSRPIQDGEFDFIVGYDIRTDTCHVWAWHEVRGSTSCVSVSTDTAEMWDKLRH